MRRLPAGYSPAVRAGAFICALWRAYGGVHAKLRAGRTGQARIKERNTVKLIKMKQENILSFAQGGAFYARLAKKYAEQYDLPQALQYFERALWEEPDNIDYKLSLASVYTDMYCFELSNRILVRLARESGPHDPECYFGMGCNFMGMQAYERARESFARYLRHAPDGPYAEDAEEMLFTIEEELMEEDAWTPEQKKAQRLAEDGKDALDAGDAARAIQKLQRALQLDEHLAYARNNLSLAYYLDGQNDEAVQQAQAVLKEDAQNVHALCNLAIYESERQGKDSEAVAGYLSQLRPLTALSPDEAYKGALTLYEAGDVTQALRWFEQALTFYPYDARTLFGAGVCAFNLKQYKKALRMFDLLAKVEGGAGVGAYYRRQCLSTMDGKREHQTLSLRMQVPIEEAIARVKLLNACVEEEPAQLRARWREDEALQSCIRWALPLHKSSVQAATLELLGMLGDAWAEELLRAFLMVPEAQKERKTHVLGLLKRMGAREPYIAYMDDSLVEARVSVLEGANTPVPEAYTRVLEEAMTRMRAHGFEDLQQLAEIWGAYLSTLPTPYPALSEEDEAAFAGALELCARQTGPDQQVQVASVADAYHTTEEAMLQCHAAREPALQAREESGEDGGSH